MILKYVNSLKKDELVRGSFILFIMMNIFNVLNYIYHFSMARLLGPSDYGILAVLFSFIYIFSIPTESIQNIITAYTSRFVSKKQNGKIKYLFLKSIRKGFLFSLLLFLAYMPVAYLISPLIKIDFLLLMIVGLFIFLFTFIPISRGIMQGEKKFGFLGINMIIEGIFKVGLAIAFVFIGWKVFGAIFGVIIAVGLSFVIGLFFIKDILKSKKEKISFEGIYGYSIPYFFAIISVVLIYSLDTIFAKLFFDPETTGVYAIASMLGKIIFFGTFAVGKAMLPLTSEKHENGEKSLEIFKKALKIVGLISIVILFLYFFFPELIIKILFGEKYLAASNILFIIGLGLTFLSFTNIILLYKLSTGGIKNSYYLIIFVLMEILAFVFMHKNLVQFSIGFLIVNIIFFGASLCLLIKDSRKKYENH